MPPVSMTVVLTPSSASIRAIMPSSILAVPSMMPLRMQSMVFRIRAGLGGIVNENVEACLEARPNHQAAFPCELSDGRPEGIEHRRHNGGHNAPLDLLGADAK